MDRNELVKHGPINIVAFGDSVTHGGFAGVEVDQKAVYHNLLKKRILQIGNYIPVNVILFADTLFEVIFSEDVAICGENSTMYKLKKGI